MANNSNPLQIVDITDFNRNTAAELLNAATSQGFLFLEGHGFSAKEVSDLFALSKEFFDLPAEYKRKFPIDESNHGYTDHGGENLDPTKQKRGDPKEALNFCSLNFKTGTSSKEIPGWFKDDPSREKLLTSTISKLYNLSIKILQILALGLDIEDTEVDGTDWFTSRYDPEKASGTTFRFLHYPGQKSLDPESTIRAGAHTDYGSMTLLFQQEGQEGLEIYSPISKKWEAVPFVPSSFPEAKGQAPPIIVNIADQLSYWTGGLLKSTIHRVKFPAEAQRSGKDRYSIVFFSHPNDATLLGPVPSAIVRDIKHRGANKDTVPITAKQHLDKRLAATYGWSQDL
ncbi:Clavaminate synthase-like protein [Metschnikowia bicuspidata var. bicuspidata NRRL YB-4993]|uniref:Clavaminate synthase-like protein n=1 Tax=Metschnikowia bicuspidata var. bicuspidata NRRL YB-4993 TaxID=869754 RepID=A0A1A0HJ92_9ASCO|nr:Clavaminate synthase-like protein [Metschnikowia bicuspidata var. bicuspidata NRRL YB-4993]OBA23908.1 Clavaminate synthase-like protein [Metschnikowia bicuspidata var. bicuspidata NRRL YB-4993]